MHLFCKSKLVFYPKTGTAVFTAFCRITGCGGHDISKSGRRLVACYISVNGSKFLVYDLKPVVDKPFCTAGNHIFLVQRFFIISIYQSVEHIFSPVFRHIFHGKVEHRGLAVCNGHHHLSLIIQDGAFQATLCYADGLSLIVVYVSGRFYEDPSHWSIHGISDIYRYRGGTICVEFFVSLPVVRQPYVSIVQYGGFESKRIIWICIYEIHEYWRGFVQTYRLQATLYGIIDREVKFLDHRLHQLIGTENIELVVHV